MSKEGVRVIEKISTTKILNGDSEDNPFFCISQQEFIPHQLENKNASKVWVRETKRA